MQTVRLQDMDPEKKKTHLLCSFILEGSTQALGLEGTTGEIAGAIEQTAADAGGSLGSVAVINTMKRLPAERILLAGLGCKITPDSFRFAAGKVALKAREIGVPEFSVIVPGGHIHDPASAAVQIVEGVKMSLFSFDDYKGGPVRKSPRLTLLAPSSAGIDTAVAESEKVADAVVFTKGIANLPPNDCTPATLARIARGSARGRIKCKVISGPELKRRGFGGITAVGQGSRNGPRLIILEYRGGRRGQRPVVIVGKAVTFDTGGISIKPGEKMDEMKFDKCGGCTVLGIMKAVADLSLPINVVGIIPSVENMPGGGAYRPGDIIRLYSGKTAEILNTDAEGRLILADALAYGEEAYSPSAIIDFATLTGACIVALGNNVAGMVTNDDGLADRLAQSSERTAEEVWRLPLNDDYSRMVRSEVADVKNMGIGKAAGTITAAAFLREAVSKTPWIHFDIAGVAWTQAATREKPYNPKGATGFGVRLVMDYLTSLARGASVDQ